MPSRSTSIVLACLVLVILAAGRSATGVTFGLNGQYFSEQRKTTEPPTHTRIDRRISTATLAEAWVGDPPARFQARWFGYLTITETDVYRLALESDDGARLTIDGTLLIDNGGVHGPLTAGVTRELSAGPHAVLLEYTQAGGGYALEWRWARGESPLDVVPARLLSSRRTSWARLTTAWLLEIALSGVGAALAVAACAGAIARRRRWAAYLSRHPHAACLLLFAALTIAHTWPLARHPGRLSRNDNGDTLLNEWAISWVAHQAVRDPLHVFDGNIFHPEPRTLAYSETMAVQSALAAPVLWLGGSPVLAYNLVLLAGFALTGWTMSLVLARWTGSWLAGISGGAIFAFNAHNFTRLPHLQAQHAEFLPLALLALDALLRRPGVRQAAALAGWFVLQALTSIYLLVITAVALTAAAAARPREWLVPLRAGAVGAVAAAAAAAALVLAPYVWPYWRVSEETGLSRSLDNASRFAATWNAYLATPARAHFSTWSAGYFEGTALFPGALALVLSAIAIVRGTAFVDPRARMCLAVGVAGLYLSFGTHVPGYAALFDAVPLFRAIRAVSRFGYLVTLAASVLAAFAIADMWRLARSAASRRLLALCPLLIFLESTPAPVWYARFDGISPIYERVRDDPEAVVVELPFYPPAAGFRHAPYLLNATRHWRPLLNGYSGLQPTSFRENAEVLSAFPEGGWQERLRDRGVTHVFVQATAYAPAVLARLDAEPTLHKVAEEDGVILYRLAAPR